MRCGKTTKERLQNCPDAGIKTRDTMEKLSYKTVNVSYDEREVCAKGARKLWNGENAQPGEASIALNLREIKDALRVVGQPREMEAKLSDGEVNFVYCDARGEAKPVVASGGVLSCDGRMLGVVSGQKIEAVESGDYLVVSSASGLIWLKRDGDNYSRMIPDAAIPEIYLGEAEVEDVSSRTGEVEFDEPYSNLPTRLKDKDHEAVKASVRNAWAEMLDGAAAAGKLCGLRLVRWGVRLWDDSYLYLSAPVLLGGDTVRTSYLSRGEMLTGDGKFTGVPEMSYTASAYRIGVSVLRGVDAKWQGIVKSIDILASAETLPMLPRRVSYRFFSTSGTGGRHYYAEMGVESKSRSEITSEMLRGEWAIVASSWNLERLNEGVMEAMNMERSSREMITGKACSVITSEPAVASKVGNYQVGLATRQLAATRMPETMTTHNGRVYMGGGVRLMRNPWQGILAASGSLTTGNSKVRVVATLLTENGTTTVVQENDETLTFGAVNGCLCYPDPRATRLELSVESGGTVRKIECELQPMKEWGLAMWLSDTLKAVELSVGEEQEAVEENTVEPVEGEITVSSVKNPFVTEREHEVCGESIRGLGVARKPIYSGGFGRYPMYALTGGGIYALPWQTQGIYGEPRLVSGSVMRKGSRAVEGRREVWYVSESGKLESVSGSAVTEHLRGVGEVALAWEDNYGELWLTSEDGCTVLQQSGRTLTRNLGITCVQSDRHHTLAVTTSGALLRLGDEIDGREIAVHYLSAPISLRRPMVERIKSVEWKVWSEGASTDVDMTLRGMRGEECHGRVVNRLHVEGPVREPVLVRVVSQPMRRYRLEVDGQMRGGEVVGGARVMSGLR